MRTRHLYVVGPDSGPALIRTRTTQPFFGIIMTSPLAQLRRNHPSGQPPSSGRDPLKLRLIAWAPWLVLAAAVAVLLALFGGNWLPATEVEVEPVVTRAYDGADTLEEGSRPRQDPYAAPVRFQASGWFEADPFPHRAVTLINGVVREVHVLEGESVEKGQPLVTLVQEDAELQLQGAKADLAAARAAHGSARRELQLAEAREESMRREIAVAQARQRELQDLATRASQLGAEVLSEQEIIQARLRLETHVQSVLALEAQLNERHLESERLVSGVESAQAALEGAEARLAQAELNLARTVIRAPVSGVVQKLLAAPGQKKMLSADAPESATVALLFQPERMQARIDVPLAEAAGLRIGQPVLLESEFLPGAEFRGRVTRIVGEADLQRNTLQAKVSLPDPPMGWRPEILCRARFLDSDQGRASTGMVTSSSGAPASRVLVSEKALLDPSGGRARVWIVDATDLRVEPRDIQLGNEETEGYIAVVSGLLPGDRVVLNPPPGLKAGSRITY